MKKKLLSLVLLSVTLFAAPNVATATSNTTQNAPTDTRTYRNPIIPGYHPDPSICRVGNDFYLVNSSFQYFPGVPIFHSRNLVDWEQIGNVLTRDEQVNLKGMSSWLGIYAPTIRYHEGTYYMITTNVSGGGNFLVTATQPQGPWSNPVWLKQEGIDPSLYFEDGKCYMVSNPDNTIMLCQIDTKTGQQLAPSQPIWRGTGGRYPEGPHLYKKDGYYYLLISEGGTELAHRLTIARSRNIEGPYEANPNNPLLTHCSMAGQSNQIQGTGHGDFVQAEDGNWWMVFLAYRNFGGSYHHLGRETYLAPVVWNEGEWPVVNGGQPVDTLMSVANLPAAKIEKSQADPMAAYLFIQNPVRENYLAVGKKDKTKKLSECEQMPETLRLIPSSSTLDENKQPTFIGHRQESARFVMETCVEANPQTAAGLTAYQINDGHFDLFVEDGNVKVRYRIKALQTTSKSVSVASQTGGNTRVWLRLSSDGDMYQFDYSTDGTHFIQLDRINCSLLSTEVVGGFTGAILGLFAEGTGHADFSQWNLNQK